MSRAHVHHQFRLFLLFRDKEELIAIETSVIPSELVIF